MVYISVRPERHSYHMIKETGEFVINLTTEKLAKATDFCGVRSGRDVDKFKETGLTREKADIVSAPMIQESPVSIECKVKEIKESGLTGDAKNNALKAAEDAKDAALYRIHFAFPAELSLFLNEEQIEGVKDGMTYGVLEITYKSHLDMIPSLKEDEKAQIYAWLKEAREFAIDAENSDRKHAFFGKYKGRINNYLAKRGYDLKKEREEWYKRVKARGGSL